MSGCTTDDGTNPFRRTTGSPSCRMSAWHRGCASTAAWGSRSRWSTCSTTGCSTACSVDPIHRRRSGHVNDPALIEETRQRLVEAGVEYCFATYVDVHGVPKAKSVPLASFVKMARGSELFTVGAMEGMGLTGPQKDECAAVPDLETLIVLPWDKRYAWFASDLYYHGEPYANCARTILKRALARATARGLVFKLGV